MERLIASNDSSDEEEEENKDGGSGLSLPKSQAITATSTSKPITEESSELTLVAELKSALLKSGGGHKKADTLELAERNEMRHYKGGNTMIRPLRSTHHKKVDGPLQSSSHCNYPTGADHVSARTQCLV